MKEIMVIKDEEAIDEWNRTIAQFIDVDNKIYKAEFIKVPETFEELKELVNKYSGKINRQVGGITVGTIRIIIMMKFDNIYFGKNGNIYFADKYLGTYTPARQWQIIKSLIGEE